MGGISAAKILQPADIKDVGASPIAEWDQAVDRFERARGDWEARAFGGGSS